MFTSRLASTMTRIIAPAVCGVGIGVLATRCGMFCSPSAKLMAKLLPTKKPYDIKDKIISGLQLPDVDVGEVVYEYNRTIFSLPRVSQQELHDLEYKLNRLTKHGRVARDELNNKLSISHQPFSLTGQGSLLLPAELNHKNIKTTVPFYPDMLLAEYMPELTKISNKISVVQPCGLITIKLYCDPDQQRIINDKFYDLKLNHQITSNLDYVEVPPLKPEEIEQVIMLGFATNFMRRAGFEPCPVKERELRSYLKVTIYPDSFDKFIKLVEQNSEKEHESRPESASPRLAR